MKIYKAEGYDWKDTRLARFIERYGYGSLENLQVQAQQRPEEFWARVAEEVGITWLTPWSRTLDLSHGLMWPEWFVDGKLNIAYDALDKHARCTPQKSALRWESDAGEVRTLTYEALQEQVNRLGNALLRMGIGPGDRVAMYLPMVPEAAVLMLATAKIGAVVVPFFSGYGAESVASRIQDSDARVLVCADGYYRRGKPVNMLSEARKAVRHCPSVTGMLVVPRLAPDDRVATELPGGAEPLVPEVDYQWIVNGSSPHLDARPFDPFTPLMLVYTSGTTGKPKGIIHTHLGFPLKAAQDMCMAFDLTPSDTLMWVTDMGWLMGPWLVYGAMPLGVTIVLYEGTPDYPRPDRLWNVVENHGVTHLGLSPTLVRLLMAQGDQWLRPHALRTLRVFGSTGEAWNETPWTWLFETVGESRRPIVNYTGGTEIGGGILACFPGLPQKPGSFSGPIPGMAADVLDGDGLPVRHEVGELVVRQPWPGMTRGFWQDPQRYEETYWSRWPGIWVHGDWARIDEDGFWFIHGRSDDTIKVAGKRVGPADYESALVTHAVVTEAVAIGVPDELKGESAVCFVTVSDAEKLASRAWKEWERELVEHVSALMGRPLKPSRVHLVPGLPKTKNGKILRRLVRNAYVGKDLGDLTSLDNPEVLSAISKLGAPTQAG